MNTQVPEKLLRQFKFDAPQASRGRAVVNDVLPVGLHLLVGPATAGKTTLSMTLADAITKGQPFLGHPVRRGAACLVLLERDPAFQEDRLKAVVPHRDSKRLVVWNEKMGRPGLSRGGRPKSLEPLEEFLHAYHKKTEQKFRLLVIDSLTALTPFVRSNDMTAYLSMLQNLRRWLRDVDAIVVVHHANKGGQNKLFLDQGDVRDHTVLLQETDALWLLGREDSTVAFSGLRVTGKVPHDTDFLLGWGKGGTLSLVTEMTPEFRGLLEIAQRIGIYYQPLILGAQGIDRYLRDRARDPKSPQPRSAPITTADLSAFFGSSKQNPLMHSLFTALGFRKGRRWHGEHYLNDYTLADDTIIKQLRGMKGGTS